CPLSVRFLSGFHFHSSLECTAMASAYRATAVTRGINMTASTRDMAELEGIALRSRQIGVVEFGVDVAADIATLATMDLNPEYGQYSVNRWGSLALRNRDGDAGSSQSHEFSLPSKWTANAHRLPALKSLVETVFHLDEVRSARVFVANSQSGIRPHRDYLEFRNGFTRLHLVLETHAGSVNGEGTQAFHMPKGALVFLEGRELHWALNLSSEPRYHLVCDFDAQLTPEECVREQFVGEHCLPLVHRSALPEEVAELLKLSAQATDTENIEQLLKLADSIFMRYDTQPFATPYDMVMPHMGANPAAVNALIRRRVQYCGL
ncbi:MAG: aspartyl/asparaginyl beta-hydroxylase domain-containing protein, partial [Steroidobacter sp.]